MHKIIIVIISAVESPLLDIGHAHSIDHRLDAICIQHKSAALAKSFLYLVGGR